MKPNNPSLKHNQPQQSSTDSNNHLSKSTKQQSVSLNDFTLLNMIGEGAYAKVYLVRKTSNQKVYALKILKKKMISELGQEHRVVLERDILANIPPHPFIIKLHYSFQNQTTLFFALDFCPGGELFSILERRHSFDEGYLKPENVILDKEGYIRISDFGLSKTNVDSHDSAHSFCGTPEYLAPEILTNTGHGKPVDWWALGNLIYEMLTGMSPFSNYSQNREVLFYSIINKEIDIPEQLSKHCKDLLRRLFEKNPLIRLGANGASEIMDHPWFFDVDWDKMLQKEYRAPFVPKLKNDVDQFVGQPILNDSYQDHQIYHEFSNFSFVNSLKEQAHSKMDIE